MAFQNKNLSVIAFANGFTLWQYNANHNESISDIETPDYFKSVYTLCNTGDVVIITTSQGTGIRTMCFEDGVLLLKPLI